jgi:penicillin G amidase
MSVSMPPTPERNAANLARPVPAWETQYAWNGWKRLASNDVDGFAAMANNRGISGELSPVVTDWLRLQEEYRMIDRPAVFEQTLDGFGTVSIVPVRPKEDLDLIYGWVTQERARFWGMTEHSREYVLEIYEYLDSLDTHHAYLLLRDQKPVALFQTYEPDADPVGECYEVEPGDIGVHLLVTAAADGKAESGFTVALLKVIGAHLFADPKHRRIVAEPDTRNAQASARLRRSGFTIGPEITLPDKTARLAFFRREDAPAGLL